MNIFTRIGFLQKPTPLKPGPLWCRSGSNISVSCAGRVVSLLLNKTTKTSTDDGRVQGTQVLFHRPFSHEAFLYLGYMELRRCLVHLGVYINQSSPFSNFYPPNRECESCCLCFCHYNQQSSHCMSQNEKSDPKQTWCNSNNRA